MANIRNVVPGTVVDIHFKGSKQLGNEAYDLRGTLVEVIEDRVTFDIDSTEIEFYKIPPSRLWRYGTSGEVATFSVGGQ